MASAIQAIGIGGATGFPTTPSGRRMATIGFPGRRVDQFFRTDYSLHGKTCNDLTGSLMSAIVLHMDLV
ncbi:MAG: hypothetical protein C4529_10135 [Deltaproteobacteria bacterium]|nr:MAG: hypothetical protein C4529_10135 [Deltaproteobacteria bacterium]